MALSDVETQLRTEFEPLVESLGFSIVELNSATVHGRVHLDLVIHRASGVSIDDCAEVHRLVHPRAEMILDDRDLAVQVASPGIDRVLKDNGEFAVFVGSTVRVLLIGESDWLVGVIQGAGKTSVTIETGDGAVVIGFDQIQKAKLG